MTTKCPKCGRSMYFEKDAFYCSGSKCTCVLCSCGTGMKPESRYINGVWYFWFCPHCFRRW